MLCLILFLILYFIDCFYFPGTGKTEVAKILARLFADIGVLTKGEVVLKTASDLIGTVLGESGSKVLLLL